MSFLKNTFLCLAICTTFLTSVNAQQRFLKKYDLNKVYNHAVAIRQMPDSTYWVLNKRHITTDPESDLDASLIHIDKNGGVIKTLDFGWDKSDHAEDFIIDGDALVVVGSGYYTGRNKIFLYKMNFNGDKLALETYGGESKNSACKIIKQNNFYYIIGDSYNVNNDIDFFLVKTATNGAMVWQKWYGDSRDEFVFSGTGTKDGGVVIAGAKWNVSKQGYRDMHIKKIDSSGELQWETSFHDTVKDVLYNETISDIAQAKDGGYFITARQFNEFSQNRPIIAKISNTGTLEWYRTLFSSIKPNSYGHFQKTIFEKSGFNSIIRLSNGSIVCAGYARASTKAEESGLLLAKFTDKGETIWIRNYRSGPSSETGYSVISTLDKGFMVCGRSIYTDESDHMPDAILLKTDSIGCWENKCNTGKSNVGLVISTDKNDYLKDDTITVSLQCNNYGINTATNANISFGLNDKDVQYVSAQTLKGACNGKTWIVGNLKANESATLNIKYKAQKPCSVVLKASISGYKDDFDNSNDTAFAYIDVVKPPDLDESLTDIQFIKISANTQNATTLIEYKLPLNVTAIIKIIDVTGRVISEKPVTGKGKNVIVSNDDLPSGICFYELWYNNKIRDSKKLANIK